MGKSDTHWCSRFCSIIHWCVGVLKENTSYENVIATKIEEIDAKEHYPIVENVLQRICESALSNTCSV